MNTISIRKATLDEFPLVVSLVGALLKELGAEGDEAGKLAVEQLASLARQGGDRHIAFLAFDADDSPIGVLTLAESMAIYAKGHYGIINEMFVAPEFRSTGVGARLIAAAVAESKSRGWRRIDVTAPESLVWAPTRRFYEQQGFTFTGPKMKLLLEE